MPFASYLPYTKEITDEIGFYKKQICKIMVPYYVTVVPVIAIEMMATEETIDASKIIHVLLCNETIAGGEHLWYIPTILMCYILTPFLEKYFKKKAKWWSLLWLMGIYAIAFGIFYRYFNPVWISCHLIGYYLGYCCYKQLNRQYMIVKTIIGALCIQNLVQILVDYVWRWQFDGKMARLYGYWKNYNHVWLGIVIFLFLKSMLGKIELSTRARRLCDISDRYSYEAYLVHQFLILGPLSLMTLTEYAVFNIVVILLLIIIITYIVAEISKIIFKWISRLEYLK